MAKIRGELKDIAFDDTYTYLDKSFKFRFMHAMVYLFIWFVAFPVNRIRYGLKVEGRENIRKNRKLFKNGAFTVCNHIGRWDMISVLQAVRYRAEWIPMYAEPFRGSDNWKMRHVGGFPIPESRSGLRKFDQAMDELHEQGKWFHLFPESCSWRFYSPIRPFKTGAFNIAYKYDIPVLPIVLSFRERKGFYNLFSKGEPLVTAHIGAPIIPDRTNNRRTEVVRLRDEAHKIMCEMAGIISNPWPSSFEV